MQVDSAHLTVLALRREGTIVFRGGDLGGDEEVVLVRQPHPRSYIPFRHALWQKVSLNLTKYT